MPKAWMRPGWELEGFPGSRQAGPELLSGSMERELLFLVKRASQWGHGLRKAVRGTEGKKSGGNAGLSFCTLDWRVWPRGRACARRRIPHLLLVNKRDRSR